MDPFFWKTLSHWVVLIGAGCAFIGGIGSFYFGNRAEQLAPFRQPIRNAVATIELLIESAEDLDVMYADRGGYLTLGRGVERLLTTTATKSTARQIGGNRVLFRGVFSMDANDQAAGRPVRSLSETEFIEIFFDRMGPDAHVLQGTAVVTINSSVRLNFVIPEQNAQERRVLVRDLADALADLR